MSKKLIRICDIFRRIICFIGGVLLIVYGVCYISIGEKRLPSKDACLDYLDETYTTVKETIELLING